MSLHKEVFHMSMILELGRSKYSKAGVTELRFKFLLLFTYLDVDWNHRIVSTLVTCCFKPNLVMGGIDKCKLAHHWGRSSATREGEVDFRLDAVNAIVILLLRQLLVLQSHHQCLHHTQVNIARILQ